jgi:hypothetical protein
MGKLETKLLKELQEETDRFSKKLKLAIKEQSTGEVYTYSRRHFASAKRAALDMKNELTKLTQFNRYE